MNEFVLGEESSLHARVAIALLTFSLTSGKEIKPFKEFSPMKSTIRSSYI